MNASRLVVPAMAFSMLSCGNLLGEVVQQNTESSALMVKVSMGDFIDKLSILHIKRDRIKDPAKLKNVKKELDYLESIFDAVVHRSAAYNDLYERLMQVNETLWALEDITRIKERNKQFDESFADDVDAIIRTNDERARIKRALNELLGSQIVEEKSYTDLFPGSSSIMRQVTNNATQEGVVVSIPTPLADLADRITILQIKSERIHDPVKLNNIKLELELCCKTLYQAVSERDLINHLLYELKVENERMWDLQDALRAKRAANCLDEEFIGLGRSVYRVNDARCAVKRRINETFGSQLVEEKCYASY